jgi:hypothetical protein
LAGMVEGLDKRTTEEKETSKRTWRSSLWKRTGLEDKTLWDLLQVLIVPLVLVSIGLLFERQQAERQEALEQQQQALEDRRAKAERALAEERAQDEALQAYLDEMGALLLAKDGLRESDEGSEVRTLARARTITVLRRLKDPSRKTAVVQFLLETDLVQEVDGKAPIIELSDANLRGADLRGADLTKAELREANLSGADLGLSQLGEANLRGADLRNASLFLANLSGAELHVSDLSGADLTLAWLIGANLTEADLSGADLGSTKLRDANLYGANLTNADLTGASGATKEQLEEAAPSFSFLSPEQQDGARGGPEEHRRVTEEQLKQAGLE